MSLLKRIFGVDEDKHQVSSEKMHRIEHDQDSLEKELRQLQTQVTLTRLRKKGLDKSIERGIKGA